MRRLIAPRRRQLELRQVLTRREADEIVALKIVSPSRSRTCYFILGGAGMS